MLKDWFISSVGYNTNKRGCRGNLSYLCVFLLKYYLCDAE